MLLGDFNAHSPVWGDKALDKRGKLVEDFIALYNLYLLNNKQYLYIFLPVLHKQQLISLYALLRLRLILLGPYTMISVVVITTHF